MCFELTSKYEVNLIKYEITKFQNCLNAEYHVAISSRSLKILFTILMFILVTSPVKYFYPYYVA